MLRPPLSTLGWAEVTLTAAPSGLRVAGTATVEAHRVIILIPLRTENGATEKGTGTAIGKP